MHYFQNISNNKFYRINGTHVEYLKRTKNVTHWVRTNKYKTCDLAHYPFIGIKEK